MPSFSPSSRVRGSKNAGAAEGPGIQEGLLSTDYALPFFHYLAIPKNTAMAAFTSYTLYLPIGQVNRLWLEFPKGCAGLAGVQIWRGPRQIFPLPDGVWLKSDNSVLNFSFTHRITTEPNNVELRGYNLDDTYNHTVWFGLEMSGLMKDLTPQMQGLIDYLKG